MIFFEKKNQKLFRARSAAAPRRASLDATPSSENASAARRWAQWQSCARSARGRFLVLFFKKELLSCLIAERTVFKMTSAKPGDMARRLG
jgi:hypothetical protein